MALREYDEEEESEEEIMQKSMKMKKRSAPLQMFEKMAAAPSSRYRAMPKKMMAFGSEDLYAAE